MRREKVIKYMEQARFFAEQFSKDRSTKVGALMLDSEDQTVLSRGYNGMPRGAREDIEARHERPAKYAFYEHAERNAIYNKARPLLKGSIAITTTMPSMGCARALLSVGVAQVYLPQPAEEDRDAQQALDLMTECGIKVCFTFAGTVMGDASRHGRKIAGFLAVARHQAATMAKDPLASATLFLSPQDYTQLAEGYSGLPRGADDTREERYVGALRAQWVEPSVRNAIYNAVRPALKGSVGVVTATTCVECARAFAAVGCSEVAYVEPSADLVSRWGDSFKVALTMLDELGVRTTMVSQAELLDSAAPAQDTRKAA